MKYTHNMIQSTIQWKCILYKSIQISNLKTLQFKYVMFCVWCRSSGSQHVITVWFIPPHSSSQVISPSGVYEWVYVSRSFRSHVGPQGHRWGRHPQGPQRRGAGPAGVWASGVGPRGTGEALDFVFTCQVFVNPRCSSLTVSNTKTWRRCESEHWRCFSFSEPNCD